MHVSACETLLVKQLASPYILKCLGHDHKQSLKADWQSAVRSMDISTSLRPMTTRSLVIKTSDKEKQKTSVNIGVAFPRWKALRNAKGLQSDSELTPLLFNVSNVTYVCFH